MKSEARERQRKHQDELGELEKLMDTREGDGREVKRKLTDLKFEHEDIKLQLRDSQVCLCTSCCS